MAEEFAEFIDKLNHEPIEDQLAKLKNVVGKMVDLVIKFVDNYTNELEIINNKIISLETKTIHYSTTPNITELERLTPPPNLNPPRVVGNGDVRVAVLKELKDIFQKHKNGVVK